MSASDSLHPIQLRHIAKHFETKHLSDMGLTEPANAEGECDGCVSRFGEKSGIKNLKQQWYMDPNTGYNHVVHHIDTSVGPHVVDFTFRQFDPVAPHPLVEPVTHYESRPQLRKYKPTTAWEALGFSKNPELGDSDD
jgi:hypothetical protein